MTQGGDGCKPHLGKSGREAQVFSVDSARTAAVHREGSGLGCKRGGCAYGQGPMITNEQLLTALNWRYATKQFDPARKIPAETVQVLKETLRLAPSSFGLDPWRFFFVTNAETREKLKAASWGQTQVTDCSHHVVIAVKRSIGPADADEKVESLYASGTPAGALETLRTVMRGFLSGQPFGVSLQEWATRQCYIALGQLMTSAALLGVDACPMEGMDPKQYDDILGLTGSDYGTVVACALGYRHPDDRSAARPKHRKTADQVVVEVA